MTIDRDANRAGTESGVRLEDHRLHRTTTHSASGGAEPRPAALSELHLALTLFPQDLAFERLGHLPDRERSNRARRLLDWGAVAEDAAVAQGMQAEVERGLAVIREQFKEERKAESASRQQEIRDLENRLGQQIIAKIVETTTQRRERARSSSAGLPYQTQVVAALQELASPGNDDVDPVGERMGSVDRKGDVLVSVNKEAVRGQPDPLILFEAKHWTSQSMSTNKIRSELTKGMTNHRANYGVLVGLPETLPRGTTFVQLSASMFAVAYDPEDEDWSAIGRKLLGATYGLTRRMVVLDALARTGDIDRADCRRIVEQLEGNLPKVSSMLASARQITDNGKSYLDETNALLAELDDKLTA
ncbi:MAG: hypothetical protein J2P44_03535 [Candidatus Dormibacteraeota bacterium]|nr:hypothetical protein [Candidatus Dormibacteraeota bacterium]